jgi:hypothetical protein
MPQPSKASKPSISETKKGNFGMKKSTLSTLAFALVAMAALLLAPAPAQGQTYLSTTNGYTLDGTTNSITIAASSATNLFIDLGDKIASMDYIDVVLSSSNHTTTAANVLTAVFSASGDRKYWFPYATMTTTNSGLAQGTWAKNIQLYSMKYLRLDYITNSSDVVVTNLSVLPLYKMKRLGGY